MKTIATLVLVAVLVTAVTTISTLSPMALAAKPSNPGSSGLERADQNVHENTGGPGSPQDIRFHEGTCQGGHSTAALGPSGCNNPLITAPGNSDTHRQDK
jgi:hypothetical protein